MLAICRHHKHVTYLQGLVDRGLCFSSPYIARAGLVQSSPGCDTLLVKGASDSRSQVGNMSSIRRSQDPFQAVPQARKAKRDTDGAIRKDEMHQSLQKSGLLSLVAGNTPRSSGFTTPTAVPYRNLKCQQQLSEEANFQEPYHVCPAEDEGRLPLVPSNPLRKFRNAPSWRGYRLAPIPIPSPAPRPTVQKLQKTMLCLSTSPHILPSCGLGLARPRSFSGVEGNTSSSLDNVHLAEVESNPSCSTTPAVSSAIDDDIGLAISARVDPRAAAVLRKLAPLLDKKEDGRACEAKGPIKMNNFKVDQEV